MSNINNPSVAAITFREAHTGPWNVHGFALTDLVIDVFGANRLAMHNPANYSQQVAASKGKAMHLVRRLPGRARLTPGIGEHAGTDVLFVVAHDSTDLDQLYLTEADWNTPGTLKILVLIEVWANDALRWPKSFERVVSHFDAVFCTLEEGISALSSVTGKDVQVMAQAVDVLNAPFRLDPRLDVLTIGRRAPQQHELIAQWAEHAEGWYHFDTLAANGVEDIDLHRLATGTLLAQSAVSICNYARFNDTNRIGSTRGTGTRFFETLASGALIAGDLPTDDMFTDQFGDVEGVASLPIDCAGLDESVIAELVAKGRDPRIRVGNRNHALGSQDLAHRLRQILSFVDIAEPPKLTERFRLLDEQRRDLEALIDRRPIKTPVSG